MSTASGMMLGLVISAALIMLRSDSVAPIEAIDGDTVRRDGVVYRLYGWDAPEIHRAKCDGERAAGLKAKTRMEEMIARGVDIEAMPGREKYGRTLVRIWSGGQDAGAILAAEGLALPYRGRKKPDWCLELRKAEGAHGLDNPGSER
jgi:micrococcal nuclease